MNRRRRRSVPDTPFSSTVAHRNLIHWHSRFYFYRENGENFKWWGKISVRVVCVDCESTRLVRSIRRHAHVLTTTHPTKCASSLIFQFPQKDFGADLNELMRVPRRHDLFSSPSLFIMTYFNSWPYRRSFSPFISILISVLLRSVFLPLGKFPLPWQLFREGGFN